MIIIIIIIVDIIIISSCSSSSSSNERQVNKLAKAFYNLLIVWSCKLYENIYRKNSHDPYFGFFQADVVSWISKWHTKRIVATDVI